jgi:hypothetical protein
MGRNNPVGVRGSPYQASFAVSRWLKFQALDLAQVSLIHRSFTFPTISMFEMSLHSSDLWENVTYFRCHRFCRRDGFQQFLNNPSHRLGWMDNFIENPGSCKKPPVQGDLAESRV